MRWRSALGLRRSPAIVAAAIAGRPGRGGGAPPATPTRLERRPPPGTVSSAARGPRSAPGQRVLVVLTAFSLADRVQRAGGLAEPTADERRWTSAAAPRSSSSSPTLGREGVAIRPEFRFTRTLNGFSAVLDPRAIALIERTAGVKGVYPVRVAYPAPLSPQRVRARRSLGAEAGRPARGDRRPRRDDRAARHRRRRRDAVPPRARARRDSTSSAAQPSAQAQAKPTDPSAARGATAPRWPACSSARAGPAGLTGVAPAATVLPIRVAAWQTDAAATTRSTRAPTSCSPGSSGPSTRTATATPTTPPGSRSSRWSSPSPRSPTARSRAPSTARLRLDTLVVAAAGNDGPAGPAFGSVGGPAGAPDALAVGAARRRAASAPTCASSSAPG